MYSSRHCPQNLWSHLVRTGSFDGRKHIMQWRSSPGGLINCSSWPEGTERLFGLLLLPLKPTSSPGSSRFPIGQRQAENLGRGWFESMTIIFLRSLSKGSQKGWQNEPQLGTGKLYPGNPNPPPPPLTFCIIPDQYAIEGKREFRSLECASKQWDILSKFKIWKTILQNWPFCWTKLKLKDTSRCLK